MRWIAETARLCAPSLALALAATAPAYAWVSPAPDLVVYCTPGLLPAVKTLAARYHTARDVPMHLFTASTSGLAGLIRHRARDDVVIADTATLDALTAENLVLPTPRATLGLDHFVLVAKPNTPLTAQDTIVLPDPTTAASFNGADILTASATPPGPRLGVPDTPDVIFTVLNSNNRIGLVQSSEVKTRTDLTILTILPAPPLRIEAALVTKGQSGNAPDFLAYIATAAAQQTLRAQGLEQAP